MPVVALDPSNTERYFYDYAVRDVQHTMIVRVRDGVDQEQAALSIDAFLSAMSDGLVEITSVGLRHAERGSNITNPVALSPIASTYGSGVAATINDPLQVTFTGRDGSGHKARVGLFGWAAQTDSSWRYTVAENAVVLAAVTALQAQQVPGVFLSIGQSPVLWHPYMNVGYNDHFIKKSRG